MKPVILVVLLAALPISTALGEPRHPQPKKPPDSNRSSKACGEYGAGFVKVEGTGTCVKIGGYVRFESGRSR